MLINLGLNPLEKVGASAVVGIRDSIYFSFITLMSVGYGDIVPVTPVARVLAIFTGLSGILYLAVFISSLIGTRRE